MVQQLHFWDNAILSLSATNIVVASMVCLIARCLQTFSSSSYIVQKDGIVPASCLKVVGLITSDCHERTLYSAP
jgi:hypothetical protein